MRRLADGQFSQSVCFLTWAPVSQVQTLKTKKKKKAVCTSLSSLLFIVLFIKSHILFLHILLVCTSYCFALFFILLHILLFISFFNYINALVWCYFYIIFDSLHCPLSGPDLTYISLLIIPCIIYYVTNKETLNLDYVHYVLERRVAPPMEG